MDHPPDEHVFGLTVPGLPDDWRAVKAVIVLECLTPTGADIRMIVSGAVRWEVLGLLEAARIRMTSLNDGKGGQWYSQRE
ncbi:hypothetical protein P3102_18975 [Amycolatopsis sp. QT-25]|uniref:hypothetical protein n=1 Tax=Amycolatopsis sp. QT-25 TaxID=3034022 RepID=UPI0023EBA03B|nr:hypothetical protein [Amycolatopsis sp. QT-25]WET76222.1 hypothetical protein P3102_18975 [Amycolatopsis sp. QT-25]